MRDETPACRYCPRPVHRYITAFRNLVPFCTFSQTFKRCAPVFFVKPSAWPSRVEGEARLRVGKRGSEVHGRIAESITEQNLWAAVDSRNRLFVAWSGQPGTLYVLCSTRRRSILICLVLKERQGSLNRCIWRQKKNRRQRPSNRVYVI